MGYGMSFLSPNPKGNPASSSLSISPSQDNMIKIRQKVISEGETPDEAIICAEVLGETSSYIRGLGYGPKPIKKSKFVRSNESSEREVELKSNLKDIQERFEEQSKIIKTQKLLIG